MMDSNLEKQISAQLKKCCKDEASFLKLKKMFGGLLNRYEKIENQLSLLEQAIGQDYDSIIITELDLEEPGPKIVYVNDGFTRMTGYSKDEVIGKTPRILQGEKTDEEVLSRLKERLKNGYSFFGNTINYKKDGSEFVNQWDIHPLKNKEGEITHWVSYQRDITDRKEPDRFIFDSEVDFKNLYEESKKIFVDLDNRGNIISSNNAFEELIGYDEGELNDFKIWNLVSEQDQKEVEYLFSDFDSNSIEEEKIYLWEFASKGGENIKLECDIHYFLSNGDTIVRMHFINHTMRNQVIETLKKKKEQLEHILSKKDEFSLRFIRENNGKICCKFVSDNFASITGLNPELLLEKGIDEVIHSNNIPEAKNALNRAFKGEATTIHCKYKTAKGQYIPVIQSFKPDYAGTSEEVESVKSAVITESST